MLPDDYDLSPFTQEDGVAALHVAAMLLDLDPAIAKHMVTIGAVPLSLSVHRNAVPGPAAAVIPGMPVLAAVPSAIYLCTRYRYIRLDIFRIAFKFIVLQPAVPSSSSSSSTRTIYLSPDDPDEGGAGEINKGHR